MRSLYDRSIFHGQHLTASLAQVRRRGSSANLPHLHGASLWDNAAVLTALADCMWAGKSRRTRWRGDCTWPEANSCHHTSISARSFIGQIHLGNQEPAYNDHTRLRNKEPVCYDRVLHWFQPCFALVSPCILTSPTPHINVIKHFRTG